MARLNIQKAKQLGYTDEQIQQYLATRPDVSVGPSMQKEEAPGALERIADWLPLAGGVAGSFIPGAGTIVGGALGSGAGALAKQLIKKQEFDPGEIAKETAMGGVGGVIGKVAAPVFRGAGQMIGKAATEVPEMATRSVLKSSPSAWRNAADVGVDVNKAFQKHSRFIGTNFDEMVGPVGKQVDPALKGGTIGKRIKVFEDQIKGTVREAGSATPIPGDDVIKALREELKAEKMVLGNDVRVKQLETLIGEAEKRYKNGITVGKAVTKLRVANRQFGKSVLEDQTGSMITSAQKLEANVLRNKLKTMFPTIGDALDNEQELIILREILKGARAKGQTGLGLAEIDLTKPGTVLKYFLGNPQVGGRVARLGQEGAEAGAQSLDDTIMGGLKTAVVGSAKGAGQVGSMPIVGRAAAQATPRVATGALSDEDKAGALDAEQMPPEELAPKEGSPLSDFTGTNDKQAKIKQAFTMAMMQNPKQAATLKSIYEFGFAGDADKKMTVRQTQLSSAAQGATHALSLLESGDVKSGPISGRLEEFKSGTVGVDPMQQDYMGTIALARSALLNAYLGGAIPESEYRRISAGIPTASDPAKTAKQKLKTFIREISRTVNANTSSTLEDFQGSINE